MPGISTFIHVIDDDEAVRNSLAFLLHAAEMEVKTYPSAKSFLNELRPGYSNYWAW
jgi:two-component system, LuxR family, response regulator FixJ